MDTPDSEQTNFSQPLRQIVSMLIVLGLVAFGVRLLAPEVAPVLLTNPYLNGVIGFVFVIGILSCFWQVYQVAGSARWLRGFVAGDPARVAGHAPRLLAPLATMLRSRSGMISANASRSILDSVATRIDESRDITRYLGNLLIFLGLLGTFYGLATTVPALVETIRSLRPQGDEAGIDVFERLMSGLEGQLGGMGTAFGASLLGLAGSLVVGLLELFAGHSQSRFYREFEEWLSTITRVGVASGDGEAVALPAGMDQVAGRLEALRQEYVRAAEAGVAVDDRIGRLTEVVEALAGHLDRGGEADASLARIAEGQERLVAVLAEGTRSPELRRIAEGQERLVALAERDAMGPGLERMFTAQERMIAAIERGAGAPELARLAEGQDRLVALMQGGTGGPELARIAAGQERLVALMQGGTGGPELARIAEGQVRLVALAERDATAPELARVAVAQERMIAILEKGARSPELALIADGQERLIAVLEEMGGGALDAESRMHLRSIDAQLMRLIEEIAAGRQEAVDDLRSELAQLSRLVRQLSTGRRFDAPTPIVGRRG